MSDKNGTGNILQSKLAAEKFMESVVRRTVLFLADEASIVVGNKNYDLTDVQQLQLKELTSIITVEDDAKIE
jgi:hypothetical protein